MTAGAAAGFVAATWDSQFFGKSMARVAEKAGSLEELRNLIAAAAAQNVDCLYYLLDCSEAAAIRDAQAAGFRVVDLRMTFEGNLAAPASPVEGVRPATSADVPRLSEIARYSHRNTRFYTDGNLPSERCDELYAVWIQRSVDEGFADAVLVVDGVSGPDGYITCSQSKDGSGSIGLCAVAGEARGKKIGQKLVSAALDWMLSRGLTRVSVVTQANNIGAQRLYQAAGMRTTRVETWLHAWPANLLPEA